MAVGVLLVTHAGIGTAMIAVASARLRNLPLKVEAFRTQRGSIRNTAASDGTPLRSTRNTM